MKSGLSLCTLIVFCIALSGCMGTQNPGSASIQSSEAGPSVSATVSGISIEEQYAAFEQPCYDEKIQRACTAPYSFSDKMTMFDDSLLKTTPHWILLAAGKTEQEALLSYIRKANVTPEKKNEWSVFMMKMWMKYPVMYVINGTITTEYSIIYTENGTMCMKDGSICTEIGPSAKLAQGNTAYSYWSTPDENATFREIERYIAEDMENISSR